MRTNALRYGVRFVALGYLAALLILPLALIFKDTFAHGLTPVWNALTEVDTVHAAKLSLYAMLIAVVANTIFGVAIALYLARRKGFLATVLGAFIDLPLALSPVVVGLALLLVFANTGWFGTWFTDHGFQVVFAFPSIAIATAFVSLPFVARELIPVLREIGDEQQQAAATLGATRLQTFFRITLPAIRPALAYGIVLTAARALGEYGAVAVVSGAIQGQTETLTMMVSRDWNNFDQTGAYATSLLLAAMAVIVLIVLNVVKPAHERQEAA
ncbi:MAG: sulfate/thiosulfate transport system permease protein [Gaiellales bacterium]|jgi:sulfate transport system permease protein|nr:sulfate/thiosulfate transport system permease protein [Gaiellales bacterium]